MPRKPQWLQAANVMFETKTGALVVLNIPSTAQEGLDLLEFPIYHLEALEDVTWDIRFAIAALDDPAFAKPLRAGSTSVDFAGILARVDYMGVPGEIAAVTGDGVATKLSEVDSAHRSGRLFVPIDGNTLVPGKKYIRRSAQRARGHDEWSTNHDEIIVW